LPSLSNSALSPIQKVLLEAKLRRCSSDAFQVFFSEMMCELHGDDFIPVRAQGKLGDQGCDGYLFSSNQLFQCYGALNGDDRKVNTLITKMNRDFAKALDSDIGESMKEWFMVHNLVEGLPVEAVTALSKLREANPTIKFGFIGFEGFGQRIESLPAQSVDRLIGQAATNKDSLELQIPELGELVKTIIEHSDNEPVVFGLELEPVSVDKFNHNDLPAHWQTLISSGWNNAYLVAQYLDRHPDYLIGEKLATHLNGRYLYLKSQDISSGNIMNALYEHIAGKGDATVQRQVAAHALLAHFFESCDIFENAPVDAKK